MWPDLPRTHKDTHKICHGLTAIGQVTHWMTPASSLFYKYHRVNCRESSGPQMHRTTVVDAMLSLSETPKPHPVRKVVHLLCETPASPKRPRVWRRGERGRFIERPLPPTSPTLSQSQTRVAKRPYKKYYANRTPSAHCHVCARTAKSVRFAICARIADGLCRKVICDKCFTKFGWDWDAAVNNREWMCVHCRGECPVGRSQCYIYSRVNQRRLTKCGARAKVTTAASLREIGATAGRECVAGPVPPPSQGMLGRIGRLFGENMGTSRGALGPRFGEVGFLSQNRSQISGVPVSSQMHTHQNPNSISRATPLPLLTPSQQQCRNQEVQAVMKSDRTCSNNRLPFSPLLPPPLSVSVNSGETSNLERRYGRYWTLSPGSDVTATLTDAEYTASAKK